MVFTRGLSKELVDQYYLEFLGRLPESPNIYTQLAGASPQELRIGLENSQEFRMRLEMIMDNQIRNLYKTILGREPDAAGLANWKQQFGPTLEPNEIEIFRQAAQPELASRQQPAPASPPPPATPPPPAPSFTRGLSRQLIDQYYQEFLGRNPESENIYTQLLGASPEELRRALENSEEYKQRLNIVMDNQLRQLYQDVLQREPDPEGFAYWKQQFGQTLEPNEIERFKSAARTELNKRPADPKIVQTLVEQLKNQYEVVNKSVGYSYQYPDRLDRLFEEQAQALARSGITNIYDVGVATTQKNVEIPVSEDGATITTQVPSKFLINKQTGQPLQTGFREEDELRQFAGVDIWGGANLGKGLDLFSIQFSADGAPIFVPVWQETSDKKKIGQILAVVAMFYAPQLGKFLAPAASAATQAAIGGAVIGGSSAAITGENVLTGAVKGAIGSITTTTYATDVGNAVGITSDVAARTVGNAVINAGLSGVQAALTPGADVGKSMLAGAVTGAVSVNASDVAKAVLGDKVIGDIEKLTNLTQKDVGNIFSNSIVQSVIATINNQDAGQAFINTAISNGVSQSVANSMWNNFQNSFKGKEDVLAGIVTAVQGVANTGVNAALYNQDIGKAIENAVPGIIISSFKAYDATADAMLKRQQEEQQRQDDALLKQIQEVASREDVTVPSDATQFAQNPLVIDITIGENLWESDDSRYAINKYLTLFDGYDVVKRLTPEEFESFTGQKVKQINDNNEYPLYSIDSKTATPVQPKQETLPITGLIDLRTFLSNLTPEGQFVFSRTPGVVGGTTQKGTTGFSFIGKDGSGRDRFQIGDMNFTVVAIDGKDVLVNDSFDVFLEPVIDPVTKKPELKPTPESEPFNPSQQAPAPIPEPTPESTQTITPKPTPTTTTGTPAAPEEEGKTGVEGASGVAGGAPSGPSQAAPSLLPQPGSVIKPETTTPSAPANVVTVIDAQNYFDKTKDQTGTKIILDVAAGTRPAEDALKVLEKANLVPVESAVDRDAEIVILKEIEQQLEAERQAIEKGRAERVEQARVTRTEREQAQYEREQKQFEQDLKKLEADIAKAKSDEEKAQARQIFTTQQRERLRETGRLTGGLQAQINAELGNLLNQYEDAQRRAGRAATQKEGLAAPQQPGDAGRGISDQDVIDLLGLDRGTAERYGFFGDTEGVAGGAGPGSGLEGEAGGSGIKGDGPGSAEEGVGPGAGDEGFGPGGGGLGGEGFGTGGGGEDVITRLRPIVIYDQKTGAPRATQGIPQRVTAQSVEGILGDKEPLFGGDEDEQRAIWNRRSLRLRKALGL